MIKRAYLADIVPQGLYGRTQHKTLGARLSIDILKHKDRSRFYRTAPGKFFLREFLTDASLPERYRAPMVARRRRRELFRGSLLTLRASDILQDRRDCLDPAPILRLLRNGQFEYVDARSRINESCVLMWSFVLFTKKKKVLSYRQGRYREDRDVFLQKRTIGFYQPVSQDYSDLFSQSDLGLKATGIDAVATDLDMPKSISLFDSYAESSSLKCFLLDSRPAESSRNLLSIIEFECPEWFEPTRRRLAINEMEWLDLEARFNHLDDFDPWSKMVLETWAARAPGIGAIGGGTAVKDTPGARRAVHRTADFRS